MPADPMSEETREVLRAIVRRMRADAKNLDTPPTNPFNGVAALRVGMWADEIAKMARRPRGVGR